MKDRKREIVERLVPFNRHELEFLSCLVSSCLRDLPANAQSNAIRCLVNRVDQKLDRAKSYHYRRG